MIAKQNSQESSEWSGDTSIYYLLERNVGLVQGGALLSVKIIYSNEKKMSVILSKDCGKDVADRANDKRTLCCNLSISYLRPGEKFL